MLFGVCESIALKKENESGKNDQDCWNWVVSFLTQSAERQNLTKSVRDLTSCLPSSGSTWILTTSATDSWTQRSLIASCSQSICWSLNLCPSLMPLHSKWRSYPQACLSLELPFAGWPSSMRRSSSPQWLSGSWLGRLWSTWQAQPSWRDDLE